MAGEVVLDTAVVELVADTEGLRRDLQRAAKEVQKVGREMQAIGRELTASVTVPIAGIGIAAFKAAADFETALTGIAKTVDAPASAIAELGESFRELSEEIPVSTNELAKLAELGGQLGIEVANLEGFVETMAALGVSTNLSAQEAGTALARLANVMGTSEEEFDRLGSSIVELGNNIESTEREIVAFGTRMAGAGKIAGLTESDVLAIGAAMSSVGVEAEAGGTAVQKVLIDINTAVAESNEQLELFANVAGRSAQEFASLWRRDAGQAFTEFVEGLGRAGDGAAGVLAELGLENQRLLRSFLSLANAGPKLRDAIELSSNAWRENTALTEEAARFYDRMAARLTQLRNQAVNVAAEFGQALAPGFEAMIAAARGVLDVTRDLVEAFSVLPEWVRVATVGIAAFATAAGPALFALGALSNTLSILLGLGVVGTFTEWASAVAFFTARAGSLGGKLGVLVGLVGPQGLLVAGIAVLTGSMVALARAMGRTEREAREAAEALAEAAEATRELGDAAARATLVNLGNALNTARQEALEAQRQFEAMQEAMAQSQRFEQEGSFAPTAALARAREELDDANQKVRELETLVRSASTALTQFGEEGVRSVKELAEEFQRIGIGGFDTSELSGLVQVQSELKRIVEDTTAAEEDRIRATQLLQQVTAEINRLRSNGKRDLQEEIDLLTEAAELGVARASDLDRLKALQEEISATLRAGVSDLERRVELRRQELQISEALAQKDDELRQIQRNLDIQQAAVAGNEELVRTLRDHDEVIRAVEAGYTDAQVAQLRHIQALRNEKEALEEAAAAADEAARKIIKTLDFHAQLAAAQARATGDELKARRILGEAAIAQQVAGYQELVKAGLLSAEQVRMLAEVLRENLARSLDEATSSLTVADAVAGGLISVADSMGLVQGETRGFVRAMSDILSSLENAQKEGGGFDFSGVSGVGNALGIAGGVAGILSSIINDDDVERVRQAAREFNDALDRFVEGLSDRTRFEQLKKDAGDEALAVAQKMVEEWAARFPDLVRDDVLAEVERVFREFEGDPEVMLRQLEEMFGDDAQAVLDAYLEHLALIEEQRQKEIAAMEDDFRVRMLVAQGMDEEAEALRRDIKQRKEMAEAVALGDAALVELIESVHVAEDAFEAAAKAAELLGDFDATFVSEMRKRAQRTGDFDALRNIGEMDIQRRLEPFRELVDAGTITEHAFTLLAATMRGNLLDAINEQERAWEHAGEQFMQNLDARELALAGDAMGAVRAELRAQADAEIFRAREMFLAGQITEKAFRRFVNVIEGEFVQAMRDAEQAARDAAAAERFRAAQDMRNLQVRLLTAQGMDREAQALRNQIELLAAIEEGRSAEYIALLQQVHAAEAHQRAVREQRKAQDDLNRSIAQTTTALNAPAGLRLSLHRWRAMLTESADVSQQATQQPRFTRQTQQTSQEVEEAASVTRQVSAEIDLVEPEALMVQPVLELVPPEPLMVAPQIEAVAPEIFVEAAASVQPVMDVGPLPSQEIQPDLGILETETLVVRAALELAETEALPVSPDFRTEGADPVDVQPDVGVDVGEVSATLQPLIELLQSDPITFEPDIRLIQPDPLLVEPELILGSGLSVGDMGGGRAAATQPSNIREGDTYVDQSVYIENLTVPTAGSGESPEEFIAKVRHGATRVIRKGGADPLRKVRP